MFLISNAIGSAQLCTDNGFQTRSSALGGLKHGSLQCRFYMPCDGMLHVCAASSSFVLHGNIPWQAFRKSSGLVADIGLNLRLRMCSKSMRYAPALAAGIASCIVLYPSRSSATSGAADALSSANNVSTCSRVQCCEIKMWTFADHCIRSGHVSCCPYCMYAKPFAWCLLNRGGYALLL